MIRKQIYLEENMIEQIKKIAEKNNISQAEVIRQSLTEYIRKKQMKGEIKDPLLELCGLINDGPVDGSINHDNYIYGGKFDD